MGTNYLVGVSPDRILETAFAILDGKGKKGTRQPLWDGRVSRSILDILIEYVGKERKF